ncbi:MAG: glucose 1-dehydrogenase [Anaerolineae bacterium]|nr:glucose 1-dehydrogenase [Anaerolineae bacterium]
MEQRFTGKVAIVTGAGQGIGKGVAMRLAREGAAVVIADYNATTAGETAAVIQATGGQAMPYTVNIADVAAVQAMVNDVVAAYGRIDILVNNAGVVQTKPMMDLSEADWDRVIDVNQRGTFFCLQAVAQQMVRQLPEELRSGAALADVLTNQLSQPGDKEAGEPALAGSYGKIVNFSSIAGRHGRALSTPYAASKAAIISITQSAALALAPYRINVNAVCPGIVPTPMWTKIDQDRAELFGAKEGQAMAAFIQQVPLKRAATAADLGGVVAFLCSTDADYITGQAINVDGGYEMN